MQALAPPEFKITARNVPAVTVAFFDALYERLRSAPGVQRVAATTSLPFDGSDSRLNLTIEHRTGESPFPVRAHPRIVSTDYFQTMGIPLVRGRGFTDHDTESSGDVAIINEAAARRYWPNEDPIGQRISLGAEDEWREIVGVVGDTRHEGLDADADPAAFLPQHQRFFNLGNGFERTITLVIRAAGDAASLTSLIRTAVASVDPQLPIGMVRADGRPDRRIGRAAAPELRARVGVRGRRAGADRGGAVRRDGVPGRAADAGDRRADGARRHARPGAGVDVPPGRAR